MKNYCSVIWIANEKVAPQQSLFPLQLPNCKGKKTYLNEKLLLCYLDCK